MAAPRGHARNVATDLINSCKQLQRGSPPSFTRRLVPTSSITQDSSPCKVTLHQAVSHASCVHHVPSSLLLPQLAFSPFPTHQNSLGPVDKTSAYRTSLPTASVRPSPPALFASYSAQRELADGRHATPPPYPTLYASLLHLFSYCAAVPRLLAMQRSPPFGAL